MPGLPGTGVGGVFYGLLILWIVIVELCRTIRGASGWARWRRIAIFAGLLAGIVAGFWAVGWLVTRISLLDLSGIAATGAGGRARAFEALVPAVALMPFLLLALLISAVHLLRWLAWREAESPSLSHASESEAALLPDSQV